MSQPQVIQYDDAFAPTLNDTVDDPQGPFAGLFCMTSGAVVVTPYARALNSSSSVTVTMVAGSYLYLAVRRVWSSGTSGSVLGLRAATQRQGT